MQQAHQRNPFALGVPEAFGLSHLDMLVDICLQKLCHHI
jgi:hypothetical protein